MVVVGAYHRDCLLGIWPVRGLHRVPCCKFFRFRGLDSQEHYCEQRDLTTKTTSCGWFVGDDYHIVFVALLIDDDIV